MKKQPYDPNHIWGLVFPKDGHFMVADSTREWLDELYRRQEQKHTLVHKDSVNRGIGFLDETDNCWIGISLVQLKEDRPGLPHWIWSKFQTPHSRRLLVEEPNV
jgi:hypothetical protein